MRIYNQQVLNIKVQKKKVSVTKIQKTVVKIEV